MAFWLNLKLFCGSFLVNLVLMDLLLYSLCIVMRICDIYILCCSIFENIFKCVILCHNVVIWEVCFEKIQVLNDFISDNSKSRKLTPWRAPYTPRSFWPLSCSINVHVENVRSCKIQLGNNILVWPCNKLCRLEEAD